MSAHHDCGSPGRCRAHRGAMLWGVRGLGALAVAAQILLVLSAQARSLDDLSGALGGAKGGTEALGGMRSLDQASPSNVAGMLQYCVKNSYLAVPTRRRAARWSASSPGLAKAPRTAASRREARGSWTQGAVRPSASAAAAW